MSEIKLRGNIVLADRIFFGELICRDGCISELNALSSDLKSGEVFISPGFIDLHIHGEKEHLIPVAKEHLRHGTTSILVSLSTRELDAYKEEFVLLANYEKTSAHLPRLLGCLLEGPFINPEMAGAQSVQSCKLPSLDFLTELLQLGKGYIKIFAMAPELPGIMNVLNTLYEHAIMPAVGHSCASFEQTNAFFDKGVPYAVHFGNRMGSFHHREPGIMGAVLLDDRVAVEVIADGEHLHPAVVALVYRSKPTDKIILISDYVSGEHRDPSGMLLGSSLTLDVAVRNIMNWAKIDLSEALRFVTINPARVLGLSNKGELKKGNDADIVIMEKDLTIREVYIGGEKAF